MGNASSKWILISWSDHFHPVLCLCIAYTLPSNLLFFFCIEVDIARHRCILFNIWRYILNKLTLPLHKSPFSTQSHIYHRMNRLPLKIVVCSKHININKAQFYTDKFIWRLRTDALACHHVENRPVKSLDWLPSGHDGLSPEMIRRGARSAARAATVFLSFRPPGPHWIRNTMIKAPRPPEKWPPLQRTPPARAGRRRQPN